MVDCVGSTAIACDALWMHKEGENLNISSFATDQQADYGQRTASEESVYIPPINEVGIGVIDDAHNTSDSRHMSNASENSDMKQDGTYSQDSELRKRGKGSYFCPHGTGCQKGGVNDAGEVKEFQRNSEFRLVIPSIQSRIT